jgi:hypothetical protein
LDVERQAIVQLIIASIDVTDRLSLTLLRSETRHHSIWHETVIVKHGILQSVTTEVLWLMLLEQLLLMMLELLLLLL